jgi:UDP-glucuronate decarboxylase
MDVPWDVDGGNQGLPGPINLGNPHEFTIRQLAEMVIKLTGAPSKLVFKPLPADDPMQRKPDIGRAREVLDWDPKVQLEAGLVQTIGYFEKMAIQFESSTAIDKAWISDHVLEK